MCLPITRNCYYKNIVVLILYDVYINQGDSVLVKIRKEKTLLTIIEKKRKEMITIGMKCGRSHNTTVKCSEELDKLILEYQKLYTD
jgi:hypothetical protein